MRCLLVAALIAVIAVVGLATSPTGGAQKADDRLETEKLPGTGVWVHEAIKGGNPRVVVWFAEQFLGDGKAYERRAKELEKWKRRELRDAVVKTLKALSDKSYAAAKADLERLVKNEKISNIERHWIVNGFSCNVSADGLEDLKKVAGVRAIFAAPGGGGAAGKGGGKATAFPETPRPKFDTKRYYHPWYTRSLQADKVWEKWGVAGQGTLNVVHDFNFVFSENLTGSLYRNPKEIPGNGKDDDGNGLVDDFHGYNFAADSANLTVVPVTAKAVNPQAMHGFMCAAIMCGMGAKGKDYEFGLAPAGTWAGVIGGSKIEAAVEWAIEHSADTYSMSFSIPKLGDYRSHWRKLMEHGSFCGVCFVSGAGNFAQQQKVPVQMRVPEDIPNAVFAATGVQRDFSRTPFSSMGPVDWQTIFYDEGLVDKPEVCAFNAGLPLLKLDGTIVPVAINGNSFAGPMMGGSIALLLSADPDLLPWHARQILIDTATDVAAKGFDHETGHGLINCYRAVKEVLRRKAVREGKDATLFEGREEGDTLNIEALQKSMKVRVKVAKLQPGGQAAKAGIKVGDIIHSYNGDIISTSETLMAAKKKAEDADLKRVTVVVYRGNDEFTLQVGPGPLGFIPAVDFADPVFK